MFSKSEVVQIFPTCLWVHRLAGHEALNRDLRSALEALHPGARQTQVGEIAWQSPTDLHTRAGFEALQPRFLAAARSVLHYLKAEVEDLYITDCWANVSRQGHSHPMHTHPNNYLSGVYYVQAPAGCGRIVFADPRPQSSALTPRLSENTVVNSNEMFVEAEAGKLVLFHSWLPHFVEVNRCQEPRVSIAFNVMLKGPLGVEMASAVV